MHPLVLALLACTPVDEADVDAWTAGSGALTDQGLYRVELEAVPDPPVTGDTELRLAIGIEGEQRPLEGALLEVDPWMPDMGHGVHPGPDVVEGGGGLYVATWTYPMPGRWEIGITIDGEAGVDTLTVVTDVD